MIEIHHQKIVSCWLFGVAALVFTMMVIGAITRLTESGLSMVEWRPLIGAIPPMNEAEWQRVFDIYRETPEYQQKNFWMGVEDFKTIFFWEWFHRFWGRLIGLAYGLPFIFFLLKGMVPQGFRLKLFGLLLLGGAQAVMGWYMVESGLVDVPAVSHYRLAAHLSLAMIIYCLLIWFAWRLYPTPRHQDKPVLTKGFVAALLITLSFLTLTIIWGAFTAGMDAGLIYNEFPGMGGGLMPPEMWDMTPAWVNFVENHAGIQFTHRWLAMGTVAVILGLVAYGHKIGLRLPSLYWLGGLAFLQIGIGIATLLSNVWIPLAALHQVGAILILTAATRLIFELFSEGYRARSV